MQEEDIGTVLAAAAPEAVPVVTDLQHRARTLGRRRRRNRNVLSAGTAGVAVVAVAGAALAFAGGERAGGSPKVGAGAETAAGVTTSPPTGATGTPAKGTGSRTDSVVDAITALLPKGDVVKEVSTSSPGGRKFTTDLVVAMPSGALFTMTVSASAATGGESTVCPEGVTCTTGSAPVAGHEAKWSYYERSGGPPAAKPTGSGPMSETGAGSSIEGLTILEQASGQRIDVVSTGKDHSSMLSVEELMSVVLNDRFVSAVLATVNQPEPSGTSQSR